MKYFKQSEFKMGEQIVFDKMLVPFLEKLDKLRELFGNPIVITSSYRSPEYNENIGGSPKSQHLQGNAVDIRKYNYTESELLRLAFYCGVLGLSYGIEGDCVHIDNRDNQIIFEWSR